MLQSCMPRERFKEPRSNPKSESFTARPWFRDRWRQLLRDIEVHEEKLRPPFPDVLSYQASEPNGWHVGLTDPKRALTSLPLMLLLKQPLLESSVHVKEIDCTIPIFVGVGSV